MYLSNENYFTKIIALEWLHEYANKVPRVPKCPSSAQLGPVALSAQVPKYPSSAQVSQVL